MRESTKRGTSMRLDSETPYCGVDFFLSRNEKLIADFANRILKATPQDHEDLKMEAAVAYYEALNYINFFKKTKFSSVFTWFYKKRLYAKRKCDLTSTSALTNRYKLPSAEKDPDEIAMEQAASEWSRQAHHCQASAESSPQKIVAPLSPVLPQDFHFDICLRSFAGKVSMKIYRALMILLGASDIKLKKKALKGIFHCPSSSKIEEVAGDRIKQEIKEAGLSLYVAIYSESSINKIVVCAHSEGEAKSYLPRDGGLSTIKKLW